MSFIKDMLKRTREKERVESIKNQQLNFTKYTAEQLKELQYIISRIYVGNIIKNVGKRFMSQADLKHNIVKQNALLIHIQDFWYMDIETGKYYQLSNIYNSNITNDKEYINQDRAFYYECYDTIKSKGMKPNGKFTAIELRKIYEDNKQIKLNNK